MTERASVAGIPFEVTTHAIDQPVGPAEWEEITIPQPVIDAAARAIEASTVFRQNFKPQWHKDIHSEALKLAAIALGAAARQQRES
jgi:hypothetical protein